MESYQTADEKYFGSGCTLVTTEHNIPVAVFTDGKQVDEETAMRVTRDALAIKKPIWLIGDSAFDILNWHDFLLAQNVVPMAPYNPRNTNDSLDIEHRVESRIMNREVIRAVRTRRYETDSIPPPITSVY